MLQNELKNDSKDTRVLAILTKTWGSVPQRPGAKMVIERENFSGTVGGGKLEWLVLEKARQMLGENSSSTCVEEFNLAVDADQCCGGKVQIYFEKQLPQTNVLCFGAGHVAQELTRVLEGTQINLVCVDDRPDWLEKLPLGTQRHTSFPQGDFSFAVVMTHSHELDEKIVEELAQRGEFKNIGLIGSQTKWRRFKNRLEQKNLTPMMLEKIRCPVGVFKGRSNNPRNIAISIAAQLLMWAEGEKS